MSNEDTKPQWVEDKTGHAYISELDISYGDIEDFLHEATITKGLEHPNVLKIIGVSFDRRDCYVVLPFMEKGNLRDILLDTQNVCLLLFCVSKYFTLPKNFPDSFYERGLLDIKIEIDNHTPDNYGFARCPCPNFNDDKRFKC